SRAEPIIEGRELGVVLERISRGHKSPDPVELQPLQTFERNQSMPLVSGVEAAAEQPDPHAGLRPGQLQSQVAHVGRVWPLPRTRYLNEQSCSSPTGPRAWNLPVAMPISPPKPN